MMILATALTFCAMTLAASSAGEFASFLSLFGFDCLVMLWSLRKLLLVTVHRWPESEEFDAVLFRRTWLNLVSQSNDSLAARLATGQRRWQSRRQGF